MQRLIDLLLPMMVLMMNWFGALLELFEPVFSLGALGAARCFDEDTEPDELLLLLLPEYDDEESLLASLSESVARPSRLREVEELLRELRGSVEPIVPLLLA
jgi:hypothetical protein